MGWVTGDEVYGGNPKLRAALEERGIGYVPAVVCSAEVPTRGDKFRAVRLVKRLPKQAWQKVSAGPGRAAGHPAGVRLDVWKSQTPLPTPAIRGRTLWSRGTGVVPCPMRSRCAR